MYAANVEPNKKARLPSKERINTFSTGKVDLRDKDHLASDGAHIVVTGVAYDAGSVVRSSGIDNEGDVEYGIVNERDVDYSSSGSDEGSYDADGLSSDSEDDDEVVV